MSSASRPTSGEGRFPLLIDKMVAGGLGLGRHEGQVVFVPRSAPGDRLLVEPRHRQRDFLRAETVELVEASPLRRHPPCPHFASCGGCSFMHLRPEAQQEAKRQIVLESLRRGGGIAFSGDVPVRTGPETGYRVRARFHVKRTRRGTLVGFYQPGTHRVVDVDRCLQVSAEANRVLREIRDFLAASPRGTATIESFELVEPVMTSPAAEKTQIEGRLIVHFIVKMGRGPAGRNLEEWARRAGLGGLVVSHGGMETGPGDLGRIGQTRALHQVAGFELGATVHAFFQANRFLMDALVEEVVPVDPPRLGRAVDLYCGVGLFSLPLARSVDHVVGVEVSAPAVADARLNARRAGIANVAFRRETAAAYAARQGFPAVDLVVADPPRAGLERAVVAALCRQPPKELRYVSCDPASLGRDVGRLREGGLELVRLVLLDFFPNTHHIESVATLRPR